MDQDLPEYAGLVRNFFGGDGLWHATLVDNRGNGKSGVHSAYYHYTGSGSTEAEALAAAVHNFPRTDQP